jgi:hypothetical protein
MKYNAVFMCNSRWYVPRLVSTVRQLQAAIRRTPEQQQVLARLLFDGLSELVQWNSASDEERDEGTSLQQTARDWLEKYRALAAYTTSSVGDTGVAGVTGEKYTGAPVTPSRNIDRYSLHLLLEETAKYIIILCTGTHAGEDTEGARVFHCLGCKATGASRLEIAHESLCIVGMLQSALSVTEEGLHAWNIRRNHLYQLESIVRNALCNGDYETGTIDRWDWDLIVSELKAANTWPGHKDENKDAGKDAEIVGIQLKEDKEQQAKEMAALLDTLSPIIDRSLLHPDTLRMYMPV